jgi:cytochrome b pre-mRNA-processing protein 3
MLTRLFGRQRALERTADILYGAIVARARHPALYANLGVPDTVSGRFEMVVLHLFLVLDRLAKPATADGDVGQAVFDLFCTDMDRSLRELGIGDLGVPKRMRQVGEAFYGRTRAYTDAIARNDPVALAAALQRNAFKNADGADRCLPLAAYVLAASRALAGADRTAIAGGALQVPDPAGFAALTAGAVG